MYPTVENLDLVLIEATPEQARITNRNSYIEWGYPQLTIDQYLKREFTLSNCVLNSENFKVWILVSTKDADDTSKINESAILAACETIKRKALIKLSSGQVQEAISYSIASVFTPPQYRHKGYASTMMKLLSDKLRFDFKAAFSFLFSDIGTEFYGRFGWKVYPLKEVRIKVDEDFTTLSENPEMVVAIDQSNLESVIQQDCEIIKKEFSKLNKKSLVVLPINPTYNWFFERSKYLSKSNEYSNILGVKVLKGQDIGGFVIWYHDFQYNKLEFLRFRSDSPQTTQLLIQKAKQEASKFKFKQVTLWNPDLKLFDLLKVEVEVVEMTTKLPSLAWYIDDGDVDWVLNEKYCWC
ncbi:Acyl-CoA N-acyltransferase [Gigaspora margarita]|uniref:Acyl-CoA N-acyltransferase n=1 Tax=Gigaspora margarita TaxID=4874 RepID=A0A8H3XA23_GIGMA|nr:Acyl-CoA N-acyltransferase [Gigaspora margarita]